MITAITAGRRIAESRKEEAQIALDQFNTAFGTRVLKVLTQLLLQPGKSTLRLQIHCQDHRVVGVQFQPDWTIGLDDDGGE